MKKHEIRKVAKRHILEGFKTALSFAHNDSLANKHDVVWNWCLELDGAILAYYRINLINDSEFELYSKIASNISIYENVFGRGV